MKKISVALLVCSTLLFSACSNEKKAESVDSTSKQETKVSSTEDSKKKAAEAKKKAEEAEKKKQEEIAKKVVEADTAMKAAEANPTDETIAAAKTAIEAIPGGNTDLQKRLETTTANLEAIKQQQTAQAQQAVQEQQVAQEQQVQQNQVQNDADGNGIPDDSPYNNTTPEERALGAQMEAEANAQAHAQENQQNNESGLTDEQIRQGVQDGTFGNTSGGKQWLYINGYTDADGNLK